MYTYRVGSEIALNILGSNTSLKLQMASLKASTVSSKDCRFDGQFGMILPYLQASKVSASRPCMASRRSVVVKAQKPENVLAAAALAAVVGFSGVMPAYADISGAILIERFVIWVGPRWVIALIRLCTQG